MFRIQGKDERPCGETGSSHRSGRSKAVSIEGNSEIYFGDDSVADLSERIVFLFTGGLTMEGLFAAVNAVLSFVTPVSDFFGTFLRCSAFGKQSPF